MELPAKIIAIQAWPARFERVVAEPPRVLALLENGELWIGEHSAGPPATLFWTRPAWHVTR